MIQNGNLIPNDDRLGKISNNLAKTMRKFVQLIARSMAFNSMISKWNFEGQEMIFHQFFIEMLIAKAQWVQKSV